MATYRIFVRSCAYRDDSAALRTDVIEFSSKEEAMYALACLQAQPFTTVTPLFRTLEDAA